MNYKVIIEPDIESGGYVAYCPTLRGCVSEGETIDEALGNIKKAMKGYLLVLEEE
ncbi:MAG: type II toxin-antitoxin system HicB family antitoxin [Thermodesulfobacteriota bacterium]|nr:type II toxin-antitoxin system HicB family antitoxin [Thermodesulfobacteriota bacterium]